jgi:hypothetical protein
MKPIRMALRAGFLITPTSEERLCFSDIISALGCSKGSSWTYQISPSISRVEYVCKEWSANVPPSNLEWSEVYWECNQIIERKMRRGIFRGQIDESSFFIMHEGEAQRNRALKHTCSFYMTGGLGGRRQPVTQPSSPHGRGTVRQCGRHEPGTECRWQLGLASACLSLRGPQHRILHRPLLSVSSLDPPLD